MTKDDLFDIIDYNYWANGLILKYADRLTPEQFTEPPAYSQKSFREILLHVMFAEWVWRERMKGNSPGKEDVAPLTKPENYPDVDAVLKAWFDEEMKMRDFVGEFDEEKLQETFKYRTISTDTPMEDSYKDVFRHLVLHGMQHRAELALMLTDYGHSPGDMDFIVYLRG